MKGKLKTENATEKWAKCYQIIKQGSMPKEKLKRRQMTKKGPIKPMKQASDHTIIQYANCKQDTPFGAIKLAIRNKMREITTGSFKHCWSLQTSPTVLCLS